MSVLSNVWHFVVTLWNQQVAYTGMTVGAIVVTLVLLPILNELVQRRKKMKSQSLLQVIGNAVKASPLGKIPIVNLLANLATPTDPEPHEALSPPPPEEKKP